MAESRRSSMIWNRDWNMLRGISDRKVETIRLFNIMRRASS